MVTINYNERNLKPNARTIGLVGGTGDGKSETSSIFTIARAKSILGETIGDTNSTLRERIMVFVEGEEKMIVAVKKRDFLYERQEFVDAIIAAISRLVRKYGKQVSISKDDVLAELTSELSSEMQTKVNSKAVLTFLKDMEIDEIIKEISDLLAGENFDNNIVYSIYHTAKNNLDEKEKKDNSKKLFAAVKDEVVKYIDGLGIEILDKLSGIWAGINKMLDEVFFKHFDINLKSKDGYYYHIIDLENQEGSKDFIEAMFSSNNLRKGERLSIEIFCEEIVIYAPLNETIAKEIKSNEKSRQVFMDKLGKVTIAIFDTRGLFHINSDDDGNEVYLNELLFNFNYDALMLVCPLYGDNNEERLKELYSKGIKNYNKQIPIFVLQNKVDLLINHESKLLNSDDPFSVDLVDEELDVNKVNQKINNKSKEIIEELQKIQHAKRKNEQIIPLICFLKKDSSLKKDFLIKYNPINSVKEIITVMTNYLESSSKKIGFRQDNYHEIEVIIDSNKLKNILCQCINSFALDKKVYAPAVINIGNNMGITPHGQGYNALRRKLRYGYGHTSNINEEYFYNCQSFSVDFPANLRNIISDDLIREIFNDTISFYGGEFVDIKGKKMIEDILIDRQYFSANDFVANILYYKALLNAESKGYFGYHEKFKAFLLNSLDYCGSHDSKIDDFSDAIKETLLTAVNKALDLNILYV